MWDVVDVSKKRRKKTNNLKLDNAPSFDFEDASLDAAFIDVFKGKLLLDFSNVK